VAFPNAHKQLSTVRHYLVEGDSTTSHGMVSRRGLASRSRYGTVKELKTCV
jgi:hypothetical protein